VQWEAQASKTISAATAYPLGQSKQKLSERFVQYLLKNRSEGPAQTKHGALIISNHLIHLITVEGHCWPAFVASDQSIQIK
jgi:hypothetical protein